MQITFSFLITDQKIMVLVLFFVNNCKYFANVYRIPTKLGTKMCSYTVFRCTKFQGNQITYFHLMVTFTPWWKKMKKRSQFWKFISQKRLVQFSWNLDFGVLTIEGISAKIVRFRGSIKFQSNQRMLKCGSSIKELYPANGKLSNKH